MSSRVDVFARGDSLASHNFFFALSHLEKFCTISLTAFLPPNFFLREQRRKNFPLEKTNFKINDTVPSM